MKLKRRGILVHPEDLTLSWIRRMDQAKLNTLGLHPVGGVKAHESLQRAIDMHSLPDMRRMFTEAASRGINVNTKPTRWHGCCQGICMPAIRTGSA